MASKYLNDASTISRVVHYVGARECSFVQNAAGVWARGGAVASRGNAMGSICGIDYTIGRPVCICVLTRTSESERAERNEWGRKNEAA